MCPATTAVLYYGFTSISDLSTELQDCPLAMASSRVILSDFQSSPGLSDSTSCYPVGVSGKLCFNQVDGSYPLSSVADGMLPECPQSAFPGDSVPLSVQV